MIFFHCGDWKILIDHSVSYPFPTYAVQAAFSAILQIFFVCGRLRWCFGRSRKVYVLIAVKAVPSRSSRYNCVFLRLSACGCKTVEN